MKEILTILMIFVISCSGNIRKDAINKIDIQIPDRMNLGEKEILSYLKFIPENRNGRIHMRIVIYYFSPEVETFSLSDEGGIREGSKTGSIRGLIELKENNRIIKAVFITANGKSRIQLLNNFSREIRKKLRIE